jgi:membrane protein
MGTPVAGRIGGQQEVAVKLDPKQGWTLVRQAFKAWVDDKAPSMGAALSYYTVFSIAPLLLIVISIAGLVFGEEAARGAIVAQLQGLLGEQSAQTIESVVEATNKPAQGVVGTVVGILLLLLGATTVFAELQSALDRIWHAPEREQPSGVWGWLQSRILSFGLILGIGFLLLVSLVVSAVLAAFGEWWGGFMGGWDVLAQLLNFALSFVLVMVLFAVIYKFMPHVRIEWHDVWIGAAVTALLFTIGKHLIGLYIGKSGVTSTFGAAGSLVVLLLWVYYSAQIFLLGAEFTWAYAHAQGSKRGAAPVDAAERKPAIVASPDKQPKPVVALDTDLYPQARRKKQQAAAKPLGPVGQRIARKPVQAIGIGAVLGGIAAALLKSRLRAKGSRLATETAPWGRRRPATAR